MMIDYPVRHQLPGLEALWTQAFGDSDFWHGFMTAGFSADRCRCVTLSGRTAAALCWFDCTLEGRKLAYLYAVATAEEFRHRGLCRMLLQDTHGLLRTRGYSGALLVPEGPELWNMYEKLAYEPCTSVTEFTCNAAGPAVPLRRISKEEYAEARREMLPPGSVQQEGANLVHLESMASLWRGRDILLAASDEGDFLRVQEYLGAPEHAPGILAALSCSSGCFRMPGQEKPFSMVFPLTEKLPKPAYFGLAFD